MANTKSKLVVVAEPLGREGLELLEADPSRRVDVAAGVSRDELMARLASASALIVRSGTQVDAELLAKAPALEVVVRAGAGTDNIDLDAATARGIVVMNTPGGNTNAAAEHTMALMLALARRVPMANASLRAGRWEREPFVGWELRDKTIGVVGLGRIGSEVAARAQAFRMQVVAYNPFLSEETGAARGITLLPFEELVARADIVTLHLPLTDRTRNLLSAATMQTMKPGAHIVNCARGGLLDEAALLAALDAGTLGGAALDVFADEKNPPAELIAHPFVVATPHLGASTVEAKSSVGIQAARQLIGVLEGTSFENAINVPIRDSELLARLAPHLALAEAMGALQAQLLDGGVREVTVDVAGNIEDSTPLRLSFLRGLLRHITDGTVNYVNAPYLAQERGIKVGESRSAPPVDYTTLVTTEVVTDHGRHTLRGTVVAARSPRVVELEGFQIDAIPAGSMVVLKSLDRPGTIGRIGTACGDQGLNISEFRLGRNTPGGEALSVLTLDSAPSAEAIDALRKLPNMLWVKSVTL